MCVARSLVAQLEVFVQFRLRASRIVGAGFCSFFVVWRASNENDFFQFGGESNVVRRFVKFRAKAHFDQIVRANQGWIKHFTRFFIVLIVGVRSIPIFGIDLVDRFLARDQRDRFHVAVTMVADDGVGRCTILHDFAFRGKFVLPFDVFDFPQFAEVDLGQFDGVDVIFFFGVFEQRVQYTIGDTIVFDEGFGILSLLTNNHIGSLIRCPVQYTFVPFFPCNLIGNQFF